jgi:hypothetical protein
MSRVPVTPLVFLTPGDVVRLVEQDHRYAARPLRLRIVRVRLDLSVWYDGRWVWLEGVELRRDGGRARTGWCWPGSPHCPERDVGDRP